MSQQQPYKRRNFFVKKRYQFKFILKFCLITLAGGLLSTGLLVLFSRGTLTSSFQNSRLVIQNTSTAIMPHLIWTNVVTLILITLATIVVVLFISHKIAGPLFRFEKELKIIAEGDLTQKIRLRKKDQITAMAEGLNRMTASLHNKVLEIRTEVEKIRDTAQEENAPDKLVQDLNRLRDNINESFKI